MPRQGIYSCKIYRPTRTYPQPQGLRRHQREMHQPPELCLYCDYQWPGSRAYMYRNHLKEHHPDVDPNEVLRQRTSARWRRLITQHSRRILCMYCNFEWNHSDQYMDHLKEHHPNVDPDAVLGGPPGSQRRDKIICRYSRGSSETKQDEMSEESDSGR